MAFRWGPLIEEETYKNQQRLYLLEQTDGSVPNTLVIANVEVVKPRVAASEHISKGEVPSQGYLKKDTVCIGVHLPFHILFSFSLILLCMNRWNGLAAEMDLLLGVWSAEIARRLEYLVKIF
ncbi:WD-40 repeat-containing protein MSI4-like isoform X2 [Silene latifolia]|uniref:WD-40 repeat-containing protein MSI4-like isoform X2 n=1 Tax=Silene latifolia TaxID=37657 RepID=UPI003D788BE9